MDQHCKTDFPFRESVLYRSDEERAAVIQAIGETGCTFRLREGWPLGMHPSGYGLLMVEFAAPDFARALARSVPAGTETGPGIGPRCRRLSARRRRAIAAEADANVAAPLAGKTGIGSSAPAR